MARPNKYNINDQYVAGGWYLPAKRNMTSKQYTEAIYELNKEQVENMYETQVRKRSALKNGSQRVAEFKAKYMTAKEYFMKQAKSKVVEKTNSVGIKTVRNDWYSSKKEWKEAIINKFGEERERFKTNALKGLDNFPDEAERFYTLIGGRGEFKSSNLVYKGNSLYIYTTDDGKIISISFDNSPESVEVTLVAGSMDN